MRKILLFLLVFSFSFSKGFVVLNPAVVEIFYLLESEDKILAIAKTQSSKIWPEEKTEKLPSVGTYIKPNIESIVELSPDLVITSFHSSAVGDDMKRFGLKSEEFKFESLAEISDNILKIGELVGKDKKAKELKDEFENRLNSLNLELLKGKKGVFFYATTPMMGFSDKTLPGDILKFLGLENIANGLDAKTPIIQTEYLIDANPDFIIIVGSDADEFVKQNEVLKHTNAYKNSKIITLKSSSLLRGTPRIVSEIEEIYKKMVE